MTFDSPTGVANNFLEIFTIKTVSNSLSLYYLHLDVVMSSPYFKLNHLMAVLLTKLLFSPSNRLCLFFFTSTDGIYPLSISFRETESACFVPICRDPLWPETAFVGAMFPSKGSAQAG